VTYQPEPSLVHGYIDLAAAVPAANLARDRIIRWTHLRITDLVEPHSQ
jgi:hypothetical protein